MLDRAGTASQATASPRRSLAIVVAVVFIDLLGFGIVIPVLPFYVRSFGVSDVFIGLLAASYSLTQFLFAPLLGNLSDERGRRPVLMLSLAGSAVAWVLFGLGAEFEAIFGTVGGLAAIFAARMLAGAMGGNIATAQAYVADVTPASERASALGLVGAAFGLGFVFGPGLGAVFASDPVVAAADSVLPAFVPTTAFSLPSFAAAGFSLLALLAAARYLPEPPRKRGTAVRQGIVASFRSALADPDLRPLVVVFLVTSLAFSGVQVAFIPFVADTPAYGFDAAGAGLLLTYIGALGVLNQGVLVRVLSRRFADSRLAVAGAALLVAALVGLPLAPAAGTAFPAVDVFGADAALLALLAVLAVLSVGNGLLTVGTTAMVSRAAGEERQGSAFGVTQGAGSLGRTVGPPVMTALYVFARPIPFLLGAGLTVAVVALLVAVARVPPAAASGAE
jgi:MFS family permease